MFKKNTRVGIWASNTRRVVLGLFSIIGGASGIVTLLGLEKCKDIINTICLFLASNWKWALLLLLSLLIVAALMIRSEKKKQKKRMFRSLSWFDAQCGITKYSEGENHLANLKSFLKQKGPGLSWWVITGVAGIGKTRLVIEALADYEFSSADVQWIKEYDDYREDALKKRVDTILEKMNMNNIIIAEDAQIYMDNVGTLISYIAGKPSDEIGDHNIRVLLLMRMGEDEDLKGRYRQLEWKSNWTVIQKKRFTDCGNELRIERYREEDIDVIVKSFTVNTKKIIKEKPLTDEQISDLQKKTKEALQKDEMDPKHLRPLFAMFITDAMLRGNDPMSWNREKVLEYAVVERQEDFWKFEVRGLYDNESVFEKIKTIICFSIIRGGVEYSELDGIIKELEEQMIHSKLGVKDFLRKLQILGKDDIIRVFMPDILSEYYVLRYLVIKQEESTTNWIINRLCDSPDGIEVFREKVRQDFRYMYDENEESLDNFYTAFFEQCSERTAYEIIMKLLNMCDLKDSNALVLHRAIDNQINNKANTANMTLVAKEMLKMIVKYTETEEKRDCLAELERLVKEYGDDREIIIIYSKVLSHMIFGDTDNKQILRKYLKELGRLAKEPGAEIEINIAYSRGLYGAVGFFKNTENRRAFLIELERLAKEHSATMDIVENYICSLLNMTIFDDDVEKKREYQRKFMSVYEKNSSNERIVELYARLLLNMISHDPDVKKKREYLKKLESLSKEKDDLVYWYCYSLNNMRVFDHEKFQEYTREFNMLVSENNFNKGSFRVEITMFMA